MVGAGGGSERGGLCRALPRGFTGSRTPESSGSGCCSWEAGHRLSLFYCFNEINRRKVQGKDKINLLKHLPFCLKGRTDNGQRSQPAFLRSRRPPGASQHVLGTGRSAAGFSAAVSREAAVWKGEFCLYGPFSLASSLLKLSTKVPLIKMGLLLVLRSQLKLGRY